MEQMEQKDNGDETVWKDQKSYDIRIQRVVHVFEQIKIDEDNQSETF